MVDEKSLRAQCAQRAKTVTINVTFRDIFHVLSSAHDSPANIRIVYEPFDEYIVTNFTLNVDSFFLRVSHNCYLGDWDV